VADDSVALPQHLFRYVFATSWIHQIPVLALTVAAFLLEVVPLELQRRIVNDTVKDRQYRVIVLLCAVYAGAVVLQGTIKLGMNVYRGWIGEAAKRDLRRWVCASIDGAPTALPQADTQGTAVAMIVAEVEPIGGFIGESISEPLLQAGVLLTVLAYIVHLDRWMAAAALALFMPQLVFVPIMQRAMNRRTGARVSILRQIGSGIIAQRDHDQGCDPTDAGRIDRVLQLNMGILKIKFTMNFLMNLCSHLQIVAALLLGSWWVLNDQLEIGGVVAFISGMGRLNDPWGDLVNYYREASVNQVKYRLLAAAVTGSPTVTPGGEAQLKPAGPAAAAWRDPLQSKISAARHELS
jgi:ABC-type bacteriocin/lantibiotic exporter with double-glycine peptidase domain